MSESSRHSYQMYLSFLNQARQHEQAGAETAWKLYLHAARCLLEVASLSQGDTRDSQLNQVQDLVNKASALKTGTHKAGDQEKKSGQRRLRVQERSTGVQAHQGPGRKL